MQSLSELTKDYSAARARRLQLDMSRGKPGADQLMLSRGLLDARWVEQPKSENGLDCRSYGGPEGIPEARRLFGEMLDVPTAQVIVCGNSSLTVMYDYLAQCMFLGTGTEERSAGWGFQPRRGKVKFLCPVPGYDRHFAILEQLGIEMIAIPMRAQGPDMALVEQYARDPDVKGLICVPKYSNPEGKTYSDETVRAFANLRPAARDFRVIWDNAYCVHDLDDQGDVLHNIFEEAKAVGTEDYFVEVTSFSKISFPGAGISCVAASPANIAAMQKRMAAQTISHDKLNQLRHARYFGDAAGVRAHMRRHAEILRPKFGVVLELFARDLTGLAQWTVPKGGYFISLDLPGGCAKRTAQLCKEAGVVLTSAGATFPGGIDPEDKNLRVAPTFPPLEELRAATELLTLCARIAIAEKT
ncbi:MAG: aminotransferase class I/II-fold pyridoxal phosphate-dependent enzyme [Oscillospiraceae bacterium]|jgi:DNA-binding transcriptional MocR family regulator|nr:aminotransferase class I/II-fold pyridoxal phosphate-dependent enzyme [Oscillospiraceae bacterium]